MALVNFILYLVAFVLVVAGAWVPALLSIKIYLGLATLIAFLNLLVERN